MRSSFAAAFCASSVLAVAVLGAPCGRFCGFLAVSARRRSVPRPPLRRSLRSAWACLSARLSAPRRKKNTPRRQLYARAARGALSFFRFFFRGVPKSTPEENHARRYIQEVDHIVSRFVELVKHDLCNNPRKLVELVIGDYCIRKRI